MKQLGYITDAQYQEARTRRSFSGRQQNNTIIAPHFVFYIEQYLEQKYGPDVVNQGLAVVTTLDVDLQALGRDHRGISTRSRTSASSTPATRRSWP